MAQTRGSIKGARVRAATVLTVAALALTLSAVACGSKADTASTKAAGHTRGLTSGATTSTAATKGRAAAPRKASAKDPTKSPTPRKGTSRSPAPTTSPTKALTEAPTKAPITSTGPTPSTPAPRDTLRLGMDGADVRAIQRRLADLGYWNGTPDGSYGDLTSQAVMAYQKATGITPDGVAGPETQTALKRNVRPQPRTTVGSVIEVDKEKQVVLVVLDGTLKYIFNTSTGSGQTYVQDGQTEVATTPDGRFAIERSIDGMRHSKLGYLWRPRYFYEGYALHGEDYVPGYPASHGCVRLANGVIDFVWSADLAPIGRDVWVY